MNWGAFAGGLSKGLEDSSDPLGLKKMMTGGDKKQAPQYPGMAFPSPGQDVPFTNEMQIPFGPQQQSGGLLGGGGGGLLKSIMTIFGGMGG